jgi:hypothetical protein
MNCSCSRETLALFIEDDLPASQTEAVGHHVRGCPNCRRICRELQGSQALIKSRLRPALRSSTEDGMLDGICEAVFSQIRTEPARWGWFLRIERMLLPGFRSHRYAFASLALLAVISASLLGQIRRAAPGPLQSAAVFEGKDVLRLPDRYQEWIVVGTTDGLNDPQSHDVLIAGTTPSSHRIYVDPAAYHEFAKTGTFPEGTVMLLERIRAENKRESAPALEASVKDSSRFKGGWGFFDFTGRNGEIGSKARALPDGTCRPCHELRGQTDHVFTQFYPVLRSARVES